MSDSRTVAKRFMDLLCEGQIAQAFDLLAPDATYRIIGTTPLSTPMKGREEIKTTLVGALSTMREPLKVTFGELIVEGPRVVALASGRGVGPAGVPYQQDHYAMVLRIENGMIQDVVEFMDTVAVETALVGSKLVRN